MLFCKNSRTLLFLFPGTSVPGILYSMYLIPFLISPFTHVTIISVTAQVLSVKALTAVLFISVPMEVHNEAAF